MQDFFHQQYLPRDNHTPLEFLWTNRYSRCPRPSWKNHPGALGTACGSINGGTCKSECLGKKTANALFSWLVHGPCDEQIRIWDDYFQLFDIQFVIKSQIDVLYKPAMDTVLGVFLNYALRSQRGGVVATTDVWMLSRGGLGIPQITRIFSGQIIATSHDLTRPHPKRWFRKGNPLISGKSRLVFYYNLARYLVPLDVFHHPILG